ncbi:hypothetical protein EII14_02120 [Alloprevotella sp. OH1205_COT-284]|uniref:hypothetical protein n=1 Tax=Alloprevotella sp. OH1205_COT-284 TaxID=2491043 RepID=UPI000F5D9718|nr:hypothetical protein [Alloprevotella sp. OH1205_COT-284]RRD80436.1 hypothetical protein EII14_02120 [Alloprevotella sp. OH1205_COT-284]
MVLNFCVAEQHYVIDFLDDNVDYKRLLPSSYPFYLPQTDATPIFRLTVGDGLVDTNTSDFEEVGEFNNGDICHRIWRKREGGYRMLLDDVDGTTACAFDTNADFSACKASLFGTLSNMAFGIDNAVMIAYAFAGAQHGVLLIHSSVPMKDGKGYLFQGKSGTGKSTHCRLWLENIDDTELLNDDNPALRLDKDGEVYVYGTPWSGKTPCYKNIRQKAGGFLRLHQAPHNKIRQYSKVEAFASILSSCSTMIWDKLSYDAICNTVSGIAARVPAFDLECLPNREAAELSHAHLVKS